MICENCGTNVDNDLIFCTNCGVRLNETWKNSASKTNANSEVTKILPNQKPPKSTSNLKWIALIIALIALPVSLFIGYLLLVNKSPQTAQNINKTDNKKVSTNKKPANKPDNTANSANQNANVAINSADTNSNSSDEPNPNEIKIDRLEIAPQSHTAYPFRIASDTAKIIGKIKISEGENLLGYVYTQAAYDEHFPDPIHKMFSFEGDKNIDVEQTLLKGKYVLIFINETEKNVVIEGTFEIQ